MEFHLYSMFLYSCWSGSIAFYINWLFSYTGQQKGFGPLSRHIAVYVSQVPKEKGDAPASMYIYTNDFDPSPISEKLLQPKHLKVSV